MVLVTGPTGRGKTDNLYGALSRINRPETNIMTVEDPIEYNICGVSQIQVHPSIDLTFASGLRSIVRQDPDVILVGEVRDRETAEIAVKAALTGHLVLSTLHTNDAPAAISRLVDMDIEPFLVSTSVGIIVAQRLVRRVLLELQGRGGHDGPPGPAQYRFFARGSGESVKIYAGRGCNKCNNTGYKGRVGLYEVMPISQDIRERFIFANATASEIRRKAVEEGMTTLRQSGPHEDQAWRHHHGRGGARDRPLNREA